MRVDGHAYSQKSPFPSLEVFGLCHEWHGQVASTRLQRSQITSRVLSSPEILKFYKGDLALRFLQTRATPDLCDVVSFLSYTYHQEEGFL